MDKKILEIKTKDLRLKLNVIGYEFDTDFLVEEDEYWLNIELFIQTNGETRKLSSPCLMINELKDLKDWLTEIVEKGSSKNSLEFIENELSFFTNREGKIYIKFDNQFDSIRKFLDSKNLEINIHRDQFNIKNQIKNIESTIQILENERNTY